MKTLIYKGIKFIDNNSTTKSQIENVDSWLFKIMQHYEMNGIVSHYYGRELITEYEFIKCENGYESKEMNKMYDIFDFFIKIKNESLKGQIFIVQLERVYDLIVFFKISFVTLNEAIKFCQILINYETIDILERNNKLFKKEK